MPKSIILILLITGLLLNTVTCKKGGRKIEIPELGFSMNLPNGWQVDPDNNSYFFEKANRENNFGWIITERLNGRTLDEAVDTILSQTEKLESMYKSLAVILDKIVPGDQSEVLDELPQTQIVSKTSQTINGLSAIEVICEANYSIFHTFLAKDDNVFEITFRTIPEDFSSRLSSFRKATASIKIK